MGFRAGESASIVPRANAPHHPNQVVLSRLPQNAHQAGQVETAVLAGQANAGRHDRQIILANGRDVGPAVNYVADHVAIASIGIVAQLGAGVGQGIAQANFDPIPLFLTQ